MIDEATAAEVARALHAAQESRAVYEPVDPAVSAGPIEDAYRIQDAFVAQRRDRTGAAVAGYKIALTSRAMQEMCGVDQPLGGVLMSDVLEAAPATVSAAAYGRLGVEFETAVRIGRTLDPGRAPFDRARVAGHVRACAPAFELVDDRNADYARIDGFSVVAENCWNAGVVIGADVDAWREPDLAAARTRLFVDGAPAGEGRAGDAMGHPLEVVAWLANLLAARGHALEAGMIVMTGSSITTHFPAPGAHLRFSIEGLGEIELRIE